MEGIKGRRFAVAGLGVSGLAACRALIEHGGKIVAFDQKPADSGPMVQVVDALQALGMNVVSQWNGHLDPADFDVLVTSPGFPKTHPSQRDMATREIWGEVELAYRISRAPILAITGTNGKSTTTVLLYLFLQAAGRKAKLCGNIAGSGWPEMPLTLAALESEPTDVLAAEISSFQLETVTEFRPKTATITKIVPDHQDRHPDFEDYRDAKLNLFNRMGAGDSIIWNRSEPSVTEAMIRTRCGAEIELISFDPHSEGRQTKREGDTLWLSGNPIHRNELLIPGEHNIANIFCAWEMACTIADPGVDGVEALRNFKGLANRMENLGEKDEILVINNSMCTNPDAVIASSQAIERPQHLLIGGLTKGLDFRPVGEYLKESGHKPYIFGPNPDTMNEQLGGIGIIVETMPEAFHKAVASARPGDAVLLAPGCASAAPYASFRERGEEFKKVAKEWLNDERQDVGN